MNMDPKDVVAIWGAFLATVLAVIKLWEVFSDRPKLTSDWSFSSSPTSGNIIVIVNVAKTPALVNYWELIWAHRRGWWTRFEHFEEMTRSHSRLSSTSTSSTS